MEKGKINYGIDIDFKKVNLNGDKISKVKTELEKIKKFGHGEISQDNFQYLFDAFYHIVDKIPLPVIKLPNTFILRARPNYNGEVFNKEHEISYNRTCIDKIPLSRFNRPKEAMFYASVPTGHQNRLVGTAILESCKELIDESNTNKEQYFTFGKWTLNEPIPVLNLCFDDEVYNFNPFLKKVAEQYFNEIESNFSKEFYLIVKELWDFLSFISCQPHSIDQQYFITTAFCCVLKEYYEEFYGILYPSAMTEMSGVNVVITPTAVDRYLKLNEVFMYKLLRAPNDCKSFKGFICTKVEINKDGKFSFSELLI